MNNAPENVYGPPSIRPYERNLDIMMKLPWSLALAAIPFIPDILETIRTLPDQIAKNGYGLRIKHGQTEVHFNRSDIVDNDPSNSIADDQKN